MAEVNPISGRTMREEILIQRGIGGRLPYHTWQSLIRRNVINQPPRHRTRGAKKSRKYQQD